MSSSSPSPPPPLLLQAQEDAEKLRSVVMPMEQEITALKAKLSTAEERVKELEASKVRWSHCSCQSSGRDPDVQGLKQLLQRAGARCSSGLV